ncbi:MAG: hypothetical protein EOO96_16190 [Pedobacter sp.]|nr:MAG: hypothetical protein EOO96_16190 [Pedobacter sp.]
MATPNKIFSNERNWAKSNLKYALIGIVIGLLLCIFTAIISGKEIHVRNLALNVLFSLFITLSIRNVIAFVHIYFAIDKTSFWKFILIFYVCNLLGTLIGIELSYLIVSLIFDVKFHFLSHINDYKFTTLFSLIIGTLILIYQLQQKSIEAKLNEKELDLIKLNQLKTEAELQALQSKINPHFLYNALNSIVSLIHEDPDKAEDMTLKLSKLFRHSVNTMHENFCSVSDEIEILNTYLAIEKVRFGDRINFEIEVDESLNGKLIPRFLLQPLVENALKHGLKDVKDSGLLKVKLINENNKMNILVADNGLPFPTELNAGYGLQSTFNKLELLYPNAHDLQLINEPEKQIKITIPF